jgi:20S proteasome subunit alpha 6
MAIAIAGLTADARTLARFMRNECLNHKYSYDSSMETGRLVKVVADKHQEATQTYSRRPYGVGLLVAGYDRTGPHLYQTSPSGNYYEYKGIAIGARAQSAKTYLERHFEKFATCDRDELIRHAVTALRGCLQGDATLSTLNTSVSVVGAGHPLQALQAEELESFVADDDAAASASADAAGGAAAADAGGADAMEEG